MNTPLVNIVIPTYNHVSYIAKSIVSALNQKTNFDFVIIIGDDCSTDGTRDVCRQYAAQYPGKVQFVENEHNLGVIKNYKNLFSKCNAKYIAILEGDDYWIYDKKLQEQTDILEKNDRISLVHTDSSILFENGQTIISRNKHKNVNDLRGSVFEKLFSGNFITAGTVCFRRDVYCANVDLKEYESLGVQTIDGFLWIELTRKYEIEYLAVPTLMYRKHGGSISNNRQYDRKRDFMISSNKGLCYFLDKYNPEYTSENDLKKRLRIKLLSHALRSGKYNDVFSIITGNNPACEKSNPGKQKFIT